MNYAFKVNAMRARDLSKTFSYCNSSENRLIDKFEPDASKMTQVMKQGNSQSKYCLNPDPMLAKLNPNHGTWERIEELVRMMKDPHSGVPLRAVKSFLSRIPDVFTGEDLVQWLRKSYGVDSADEAVHLGTLVTLELSRIESSRIERDWPIQV